MKSPNKINIVALIKVMVKIDFYQHSVNIKFINILLPYLFLSLLLRQEKYTRKV